MSAPTESRILVIEDDLGLQEMLRRALHAANYDIVQEFDGLRGLETAQALLPDLIILDIMMPILDGRDVLGKLRADERTSKIPVLVISARDRHSDRIAVLELGADDYIEKPFSIKMLLNRVQGRLLKAQEESP